MNPIRILSPELTLKGEVDNYLSFSLTQNYHGPGGFQLVLNAKVENAHQLKLNRLVLPGAEAHKTGIIRHKEISTGDRGEEILMVKGYTLNAITAQRLTIPPVDQAQDVIEAQAETVLKHYVQRNCLEVAGMEFPFLTIAADQHRGPAVKWFSRYQNLGQELERISKLTGLGWRIAPDFDTGQWVFDVYQGKDLTAGQSELPPVIFSPEFDNVKAQEFVDSLADTATCAVVAGQGEGAEREIALVESGTEGLDKHVIFVDARDIEDSADLPGRGESQLAEHSRVRSFQAQVLTKGPFKYGEDWDVGDVVTVKNPAWGLSMDTRITAVEEVYEAKGVRLNVTFGRELPTLTRKVKGNLTGKKI